MRLIRRLAIVPFLALPATAAETDFTRFPLAMEAGDYRGMIVYPDAGRTMRIVFLSVTIERPTQDSAVLRIGDDGRVIVQVATDEGFATGAVVDFDNTPIELHADNGQVSVKATPQALSLPLSGDGLGTVTFDTATVAISWPTLAATTPQDTTFDLGFDRADFDDPFRAWLAHTNPPPFNMDGFDLRGRITVLLDEDIADMVEPPSPSRIEIDHASADLFDGRIEVSGVANFAGDALTAMRGLLRLDDFAGMLERSAAAGVFVPEAVMPFALLAVALAEESTDGALSLSVDTADDGGLIVNGTPIPLSLRR